MKLFFLTLLFCSSAWSQYRPGAFWQVITTTPICTVSTAISGWRPNASETITFSCTTNYVIATPQCQVNGGAWVNCSTNTTHVISGITTGATTTFSVRATDYYGKVSVVDVNATRSWQTDLTAPAIAISAIPGTNTGSPSASFTGSDAQSGISAYHCSYDTGAPSWVACSSPYAGATGAAGVTYVFRVRATNGAGLQAIDTRTWTNGNWSGYGGCSVSCGGGVQTRYCTNPAPSASPPGLTCAGSATIVCNTTPCCTAAHSTTNMCPGYKYFYSAFAAGGCPGSMTSDASTNYWDLCTDISCGSRYPVGTTHACRSNSATLTNSATSGKLDFRHECTCN